MGQKVNPHGIRVGVIKDWDSRWYAEADFADCLVEDYNIRKFLKKRLFSAGISKVSMAASSASKRPDTLGTSFSGNTISAPNASASTVKSIITVAAAEGYLSQSALIAS